MKNENDQNRPPDQASVERQDHNLLWYNDTLAICNIKVVNDHFFEISQINHYYPFGGLFGEIFY